MIDPRLFGVVTLLAAYWLGVGAVFASYASHEETAYFVNAEQRFRPPDAAWFYQTQTALRSEVRRVSTALEASGEDNARRWKELLRWELLEKSIKRPLPGKLEELAEARRWLYSNTPGLESEGFAEIRRLTDAHLDAVLAFSYDDFRSETTRRAAQAAALCNRLQVAPNEPDASKLGELLGWFERVRQFPEEVALIRSRFSSPNLELLASEGFIRRITASQWGPLSDTVYLRQRTTAPRTRRLQRERTLDVSGTAATDGLLALKIAENNERAEFHVVYTGGIGATYQVDAGPVALHMRSSGEATATKPVYFDPAGLDGGPVEVDQRLQSWLSHVEGDAAFLRRIAKRRANHPVSRSVQQAEALATSLEQLQEKMDAQVEAALEAFRTDGDALRRTLSGYSDVAAPLEREGAAAYFQSAYSTSQAAVVGVMAASSEQLGAVVPPPPINAEVDLAVRIHTSALNNPLETMLGGKKLHDKFFMKYGEIIHAELPLPLMVHDRASRWAVWARKRRPLLLRFPRPDRFELVMSLEGVEIDDTVYRGAAVLTMDYMIEHNALGDAYLKREGDVQVETKLPAQARQLLKRKFGALFGPTITGGGVIIPSGGALGMLKNIELANFSAEGEWMAAELRVPQTVIDEFNRWRERQKVD